MIEYKDKKFFRLQDRGESHLLKNMIFESCEFSRCLLSLTTNISNITTLHNITVNDCTFNGCQTGPTIYSNVSISNIRANDLMIIWSPYCDRVTLSGNIARMRTNTLADPTTSNNEKQIPFDTFRKEFYASVDWALDISKARFRECDLESIPAHLIRRDPESQVVVTRERALEFVEPGWVDKLNPENKHWANVIEGFLSKGDPDIVLIAPLGASKDKRDALLNGLKEFRQIGLAEPD